MCPKLRQIGGSGRGDETPVFGGVCTGQAGTQQGRLGDLGGSWPSGLMGV